MPSSSSNPFVVGLTGGVASGKTVAAQAFESLGVPVIDTDALARDVVVPGSAAIRDIREAFGSSVLRPDGGLDRRAMRLLAFQDDTARRRLEAIVHPRVAELLDIRLAELGEPWCVVAIPLLVEAGWVDRVDRVLVVDVPPHIQRDRLVARDGIDEAAAKRIMSVQAERDDRLRVAHDVLDNSGEREDLAALANQLFRVYEGLAQEAA